MTPLVSQPAPGQRMRFVVGSAEEAVNVIKEKMGEAAQVLSVKQVAGNGLARFLSSPRLEVIAWIPPAEADLATDDLAPASEVPSAPDAIQATVADRPATPGPVFPPTKRPEDNRSSKSAPPPPDAAPPARAEGRLERILGRAGFDAVLLESLLGSETMEDLARKPIEHAITHLRDSILQSHRANPSTQHFRRIAFLGTSGSGKTTALCKWLTREVFVHNRQSTVVRIDMDGPHFGDGLDAFCEALGVVCCRSPEELATLNAPTDRLLVDVTGCDIRDYKDSLALRRRLDSMEVDTRILVLNAAYEADILKMILRQAKDLDPTHLIFSHGDLLMTQGKLWPFALQSCHPPILFLGTGPNIAGDFIDDVINHLLQRTLP